MSNIQKLMMTVATMTTLTACGGGGGGSDSPSAASPPINSSPVSTPTSTVATTTTPATSTPANVPSSTQAVVSGSASSTTPAPEVGTNIETSATIAEVQELQPSAVTRTSELTAEDDFSFTSSYDISVSIDLGSDTSQYLNICHEFTNPSSTPIVNYGSCVLKAPLQNGQYAGSISLTNDVKDLVIAIWGYDGAEPSYYFWNRTSQGDGIFIN